MKFETFERLNTGAVVLNAQEIRNSLYRGSFNKLLRSLVRNDEFRLAVGTARPRRRMVDEELILRFFALREGLKDYRPPLKRFLNNYMGSVRDAPRPKLKALETLFEITTDRVALVFGGAAFRVTNAQGKALEPAVNRALFEAQMLAFSWIQDGQDVASSRAEIRKRLAALYKRPAFQDAIQRATGDRARTIARVKGVVAALQEAGLTVKSPSGI
jgi:hypothetical protein